MLCLEYQYLRVITGSADGKIRIWNILNGDCIRVMRGNSLCDPVLSITIVDNRILINTENNVIMMEFEKIKYEYDVDENETNTSNVDKNKKQLSNGKNNKKSKNYASIRASRMELVSTPNPKLFEDGRKSVLDHSARPISAKNLKDAKLVHQITSKPSNLPRNSLGDVSDSALQKHHTLINNINQTIQSRTSLSVLSYTRDKNETQQGATTSRSKQNKSSINNNNKDENNLNENETNSSETLNATKSYLRDQLKELKQYKQMTKEEKEKHQQLNVNTSEDAKSCIESRIINKMSITKQCVLELNGMIRPTSSPSKVDTKTKIKRNQTTASAIAYYKSSKKDNDLDSNDGENDDNTSDSTFDRKAQVKIYTNPQTQPVTQLPSKLVSKMFETKEKNLKTNLNMHPIDVKSRLPNPKKVNLIRPQTVQAIKSKMQTNSNNNSLSIDAPTILRSKSAFLMDSNRNPSQMTIDRSKTPITSRTNRKHDTSQNAAELLDNKLSSHENLNLMTFKEIDLIVDKINGYFGENNDNSDEKNKNLKQAKEIYKKMWLLKSNGLFHGSLLSRPRAIAPEIRE